MVEADVVKSRGGLEAGDMTAQPGVFLVRAQDNRGGVPSDDGADAPLDFTIARVARLQLGRNRIQIGRVGVVGKKGAALARLVDQILQQKVRAIDPFSFDHRLDRIEPFIGLQRIYVMNRFHNSSFIAARDLSRLIVRASPPKRIFAIKPVLQGHWAARSSN